MTLVKQLGGLESSGLIRIAQIEPEIEYLFRHALVQDAAYETLLKHDRKLLHRQVGETLERMYPDSLVENAARLAHHFDEAQDYKRALKYYTRAGDTAYQTYANAEAIEHYRRALACLEKVEGSSEELVHLYSRLGRTYELNSQFDDALRNYQEMLEIAIRRGDKALKLASLTAQCIVRAIHTPLHDTSQARTLAEQALALATQLGDRATEAKVLWAMQLVEVWGGGDRHKALEYGLRSLELARELGLKEQMGFTLTNLVTAYWNLERLDAAREALQEAQAIWQELGNLPMLLDVYTVKQAIHLLAGEFDTLLSVAQEALHISKSIGNLWNQFTSLIIIGITCAEQGEVKRAIETLDEVLRLSDETGFTLHKDNTLVERIPLALAMGALHDAEQLADELYERRESFVAFDRVRLMAVIIRVKIARGALEQAQPILKESLQGLDLEELPVMATWQLLLAEIHLLLTQGNPERALERTQYLVARSRRVGLRLVLPEALWLQGKAFMALNRTEEAHQVLVEAQSTSEETGERRMRWRILAARADVETASGNAAEAKALRKTAREVIDFIADHAGSSELRHSFLNLPDVRSLLGE